MKQILLFCAVNCAFFYSNAQEDGHQLWLRNKKHLPVSVSCNLQTPTTAIAIKEVKNGWQGRAGESVVLNIRKDKALTNDGYRLRTNGVTATTGVGLLYGVYELLRRQQTGQVLTEAISNPSYQLRLLNHWDNPDGSVERGYAGKSIFWRTENPFVVTHQDKTLWQEYARANASIGINGAVINNVNASPLILTAAYLNRAKSIAAVLRPYGIKTYLAVKFSSPIVTGKLSTADPLNAAVVAWWKQKVKEIYDSIPDFGGILVKASSEGQPGPQDYGRTHADGANMLADALKPYGGIVMWRAFVYSSNDKDRAKQAYNEFMPLDGQFRENVIIQVKNGPLDFQPREPFSPLFGAMKKTPVMPEFQITMEYLGHSTDLVFLAPMWEECLQTDTYQQGVNSTVARCTDGRIYQQPHTAIAGVSNVGLDTSWTGHHFAQANWYAFGRLAWNDMLTSDQIADEWIRLTFSSASAISYTDAEWNNNFLVPVKDIMLNSREAAVNYMMPMGLHHIMSARNHYGPGPWWAPKGMRADWTPPYYHQADTNGIGFNRTSSGSGAVSQYHQPLDALFDNPVTCPDGYLLWFHHLPWNFKTKSGRILWDELCYHYEKGVEQVRSFQVAWNKAAPYADQKRFLDVQRKLRDQCTNAVLWKDACLLYFQQFSRLAIPAGVEQPVHKLEDMIENDMRPGK